jgi:hypothetical protein
MRYDIMTMTSTPCCSPGTHFDRRERVRISLEDALGHTATRADNEEAVAIEKQPGKDGTADNGDDDDDDAGTDVGTKTERDL